MINPIKPNDVPDYDESLVDQEVKKVNDSLLKNPYLRRIDVDAKVIEFVANLFTKVGWIVTKESGSDYRESWSYITLKKPIDAQTTRDHYSK